MGCVAFWQKLRLMIVSIDQHNYFLDKSSNYLAYKMSDNKVVLLHGSKPMDVQFITI